VDNSIIKCAIVDDSRLQRLAIVKLIEDHPGLDLVAEWNNAIETKNGLLDTKVDLLFLDIEMPILTGFDLLDDLENKPKIIFVTGKTKYAFKAFDYDAVDYLRKPLIMEDSDPVVVLATMKSFESQLSEGKFLRVHKSFIVVEILKLTENKSL